ncbi:MAG: hypothetical protein MSH60_10195 [Ruminococcus sp.]|nr:hypothetical protein [Ruminococcus sp.]
MFENNESKYADIIDLPRPKSKHNPMSMHDRAAQFSSFSALTGLDDELSEAARITDCIMEISEDRAAELNNKIQLLIENAPERPKITATYFVPDEAKDGGSYKTVTGCFKRVDDETHDIILSDGTVIPAAGLYALAGEIFDRISEISPFSTNV